MILLTGFSNLSTLFFSVSAGIPSFTANMVPETVQNVVTQLSAMHPVDVYLSIVERLSAVLYHLFATFIIFKGVIDKKARYYFLAVLCHTVFNFAGVVLMKYTGIYVSEAVMLIMGLAGGYYILRNRKSLTKSLA
jgi:uncharacterized membrane protein YhfC